MVRVCYNCGKKIGPLKGKTWIWQ